jgi:hypothetical protein
MYSFLIFSKLEKDQFIEKELLKRDWKEYNFLSKEVSLIWITNTKFYEYSFAKEINCKLITQVSGDDTVKLYSLLEFHKFVKKNNIILYKKFFNKIYQKIDTYNKYAAAELAVYHKPIKIDFTTKGSYPVLIKNKTEYKKIISKEATKSIRSNLFGRWIFYDIDDIKEKYSIINITCIYYNHNIFYLKNGYVIKDLDKKTIFDFLYYPENDRINNKFPNIKNKINDEILLFISIVLIYIQKTKCYPLSNKCLKIFDVKFLFYDNKLMFDKIYQSNKIIKDVYLMILECIIDKQFPPKKKIKSNKNKFVDVKQSNYYKKLIKNKWIYPRYNTPL